MLVLVWRPASQSTGPALFLRRTAILLLVLAALGHSTAGAQAQSTQRPFGVIVEDWNQSLDLIEQELSRRATVPAARANTLKRRLAELRAAALEIEAKTEILLRPLRTRAGALGPPPAEGEPPEFEAIAAERRKLTEEIANYETRIKQAVLARNRSNELAQRISTQTFDQAVEALLKRFPAPLAPSTVSTAVPEFLTFVTALANAPFDWWRSLTPSEREAAPFNRIALVLGLALALGVGIRLALIHWMGRDPSVDNPSYARRLSAGISEGLALGIVPALIFGGPLYAIASHRSLFTGLFGETMVALCIVLIFLVLAFALPRAVLAPELPAWRLVALTPNNARTINHRITFLASVFAVGLFFWLLDKRGAFSPSLTSLFEFTITTLVAGGVLALVRGRLWVADRTRGAARPDGPEAAASLGIGSLWAGLRLIISLVALVAFGATLVGYARLGAYLSGSLLASGVVVGGLFLVRGLTRELIGMTLRARFLRDHLAVRHGTRSLFKFWARALLDLVIFSSGIFLILTVWGVPLGDMWTWTKQALQGIAIGNVTISITDILVAIGVFLAALLLTRMLQRLLTERVLPRTGLDTGLRHSLSAGFGYMGLVVALALGVAAMGLDLTNLALIFGALSVGIGFGLQNVVNNFVSGMILLIERPIKVGDWVIVGTNEGFVKHIKLRATEIETFQHASIMIPNSEIISMAVTNWTHKDRIGRVDVPVRVAYGSDADQVLEVLNRCLKEHAEVVNWPAPFALFMRLGENAMEFEARGFIGNVENMFRVRSDLLVAIEKALREAGITIPLPQRDLHLKNLGQLTDALSGRASQAPSPPRLRKVEAGGGESQGDG